VVLPEHLDKPSLVLRKEREILDEVEQPCPVAGTAQHHLQRHAPRLVLALDALPLEEPVPFRGERADTTVGTVAGDQQRAVPKERRDFVLVMLEVLVEGGTLRHARLLQFHHHPR
jgi:hypothetical protein